MDSLNALLSLAKQDTTRLRLYFELVHECDAKDNLKYGQAAADICDKLIRQSKTDKERTEFLRKKAEALSFISFYYQDRKDIDIRIEYLKKSQAIHELTKDTVAILNKEFLMADIYRFAGNLPKTLEHYQKGLAYSEKINFKKGIARFLAQLGDMYSDQSDTSQAIQMYNRMLAIAQELNDRRFLAITTMKVGGLYNALGQYDKALDYYKQSGLLFKEFDDTGGRMEVHKNTGDTYKAKGDLKNAIINYRTAIQLAREIKKPIAQINLMFRLANSYADIKDFKSAIAVLDSALILDNTIREGGAMSGLLNYTFAKIYFKKKDYKQAKTYSDISLQLNANNGIEIRRDIESLATRIDSACGDFKGAYLHHLQYIMLRDKLSGEEIRKAATKEKFQNEYDKQKAADKAEQEKKDIIAQDEKRKQIIITWSVVCGLLLVVIFAGFILRSLNVTRKQKQVIELKEKETAEQKHLLEEKQKEIIDSITYARRIQRALITNEKYIDKSLNKLQDGKS